MNIALRLVVFTVSLFSMLKIPGFYDIYAPNEQSNDLKRIECSLMTDAEILFIGGSYSYSSLNPIIFDSIGYNTFNLSISGSGVYFTELILEDYYNSVDNKPKILVFDISHFAFCDKSDDFSIYALHRHLRNPMSHESLILKYPDAWSKYFSMLMKSCKKGMRSFLFHDNELVFIDKDCVYKGFYPDYSIASEKTLKKDSINFKFLKEAIFDKKKFDKFLEITKKYSDLGLEIFWFQAATRNLEMFFNSEFRDQYNNCLKLLRVNTNITEIDMSDLKLNNSDYRNTDHLNFYGAKKFSHMMSKKLKNRISK